MSVETIRIFLLWSTIANYAVLMVWVVAFVFAHDWMHGLHGRWFHMSREQFDAVHYTLMGGYKVGILMLNLVPCIVLYAVG